MGKEYQKILYSSSDSLEDINIVEDDENIKETSHVLNVENNSTIDTSNSSSSNTLLNKLKTNLNSILFKSNNDNVDKGEEGEEEEDNENSEDDEYEEEEEDNNLDNNRNQIPLYSIGSMAPWTMRNIDDIVRHPTSTGTYDYITTAIMNDISSSSPNITTTTTTTSNIRYPTRSLMSHRQLNENQSNLMKNRDILIISQPDKSLSIGFNIDKFTDFNKTGEHNINGYYSNYLSNDEMPHQRPTFLQEGGNTSPEGYSAYLDSLNYHDTTYLMEMEKRQRLLMTLSMIEIFYYILILTSVRSISTFLGYLLLSIINNVLGITSMKKTNKILFSFYLMVELLLLVGTYFMGITGFILLKFIIFVIACRVRQDLNIYPTINL